MQGLEVLFDRGSLHSFAGPAVFISRAAAREGQWRARDETDSPELSMSHGPFGSRNRSDDHRRKFTLGFRSGNL